MTTVGYVITQAIKSELHGTPMPEMIPLNDGTWVRLTDWRIGVIRGYDAVTGRFIVEMVDTEFGSYAWELIALRDISHAIAL